MSYLLQWYDPELEIKDGESKDNIAKQEVERLTLLYHIAMTAQAMPRRLGGDATAEDLANDKKRCKRVAHAAGQLVLTWGERSTIPPLNGDPKRQAAQVDWKKWWADHGVWLYNRLRYIATWSIKSGGDEKWAKGAAVRLNNEIKWMGYALRD